MIQAFKEPLKGAIRTVRRPYGDMRTRRAVRRSHGPAKLVLGSSHATLDGWINTDASWRATNYLDVTRRWPLPDASVRYVFADNVIEHLTLDGARAMLREARRVLTKEGRVRIATPDIGRIVEHYMAGFSASSDQYNRQRDAGYLIEYPVDFLRIAFCESGHWRGYLYDEYALARELSSAGFSVLRFEAGESDTPELSGIESRCTPADQSLQLVLEGSCSPGLATRNGDPAS